MYKALEWKISIGTTGDASVLVGAGTTVWVWYLDWKQDKDKWVRQG